MSSINCVLRLFSLSLDDSAHFLGKVHTISVRQKNIVHRLNQTYWYFRRIITAFWSTYHTLFRTLGHAWKLRKCVSNLTVINAVLPKSFARYLECVRRHLNGARKGRYMSFCRIRLIVLEYFRFGFGLVKIKLFRPSQANSLSDRIPPVVYLKKNGKNRRGNKQNTMKEI